MNLAILLIFSFVLILGAFANDVLTIEEFGEKYGAGNCSAYGLEFFNITFECTEKVDKSIKEDWHYYIDDEWCKYLENILGCLDPYDECYDIEEMKKLNATVLLFVVDLLWQFGPWHQL